MEENIRRWLEAVRDRWPFTLPQSAALAIVLFTATLLGVKLLQWLGDTSSQGQFSEADAPVVGNQPENTLPVLLSANLFGKADPAAAAVTTGTAAIAASNSGLTLRAAFAPSGEVRGGAIIESGGAPAQWYRQGDRLAGGLVLREIHNDHVILERNGSLEKLAFPTMEALAATVVGSATSSAPLTSAPVSSPGAGKPQPIPANLPAEEKARLIRQRLEELRNRSRT